SEIGNIFDAASTVLLPYDANKASMVIASIVIDSKGRGRVCWVSSRPDNSSKLKRGDTVTLPESVKVPSTSVIMASATYSFTPILGDYIGAVTLGDNPIYTRPRTGRPDGTDSIEQIVRDDVKGCPNY